jgi:hypothetical protein
MNDLFEIVNAYRSLAQQLVSFLLAAAIWRWGGGPERWMIGIFMVTMVLPIYVIWSLGLQFVETGPYAPLVFMVDGIAAALYFAIALHANRNYPLWVAGFQLVAIVAHIVQAMIDTISPLAFAILVIGPSYGQLLVMVGGFVRHVLRERRFGPYREWRLSPPGLRWLRP